MVCGDDRKIEVVPRVVTHADLLHHAPGSGVRWNGERHDLLQADGVEAERGSGASAFGSVAPAPLIKRQSPSNFDARSEMRIELRDAQTDEPDERRSADDFHGPHSKAVLHEVPSSERDRIRAFLTRHQLGVELAHARVRIERRKRIEIRIAPLAQTQTLCYQFGTVDG